MSNAAYVIPKTMPSHEDVDKTIREIVTARSPTSGCGRLTTTAG